MELQRLEDEGIISPVQFSSWAAPIVPVVKSSGKIRICGDYKVTINQALQPNSYPLPRVDELFASLSGGCYFSKLDLSSGGSRNFETGVQSKYNACENFYMPHPLLINHASRVHRFANEMPHWRL